MTANPKTSQPSTKPRLFRNGLAILGKFFFTSHKKIDDGSKDAAADATPHPKTQVKFDTPSSFLKKLTQQESQTDQAAGGSRCGQLSISSDDDSRKVMCVIIRSKSSESSESQFSDDSGYSGQDLKVQVKRCDSGCQNESPSDAESISEGLKSLSLDGKHLQPRFVARKPGPIRAHISSYTHAPYTSQINHVSRATLCGSQVFVADSGLNQNNASYDKSIFSLIFEPSPLTVNRQETNTADNIDEHFAIINRPETYTADNIDEQFDDINDFLRDEGYEVCPEVFAGYLDTNTITELQNIMAMEMEKQCDGLNQTDYPAVENNVGHQNLQPNPTSDNVCNETSDNACNATSDNACNETLDNTFIDTSQNNFSLSEINFLLDQIPSIVALSPPRSITSPVQSDGEMINNPHSVSMYSPPPSVSPYNSPSMVCGTEQTSPLGLSPEIFEDIGYLCRDSPPKSYDAKLGHKKKTRQTSITIPEARKKMQELSLGFEKRDCCKKESVNYQTFFQMKLDKLSGEHCKKICKYIAQIKTENILRLFNDVLNNMTKDMSEETESVNYGIFVLLCMKIMSSSPEFFISPNGLWLLYKAALHCNERPMFVGYLVECALKAWSLSHAGGTRDVIARTCIFDKLDANGENLIYACAKRGDTHSDVLACLLRESAAGVHLFNQHQKVQSLTALHVACKEHSQQKPYLHTVHVLIKHGKLDVLEKEMSGGESALHLAVTAAAPDIDLVLAIFSLAGDDWQRLANAPKGFADPATSLVRCATPKDDARATAKRWLRMHPEKKYPQQIIDFLQKIPTRQKK